MTQTMHYLAEARGALARAAHGLVGSAACSSHGLDARDPHDPQCPYPQDLSVVRGSQVPCVSADAALASLTNPQLLESTVLIEELSR
ncbi:MAG: hypothetical protein JWP70_2330 [Leifsonia sp.]|nr:hypothetical protein [Leifsonia sp.]